jgi:bacteriocin-like protein
MSDEIKKATDETESVPPAAASELNEDALKHVTGGGAENFSLEFGKIAIKYEPQKN